MNRKLLETFLSAARLGSFRAAAANLHSTQPAVSMRIRELERDLGVQLFERGARSSYLTAKGEELVPFAERTLALLREMQHAVADPRTVSETIRVGVAEYIAITWLPELVGEIARRFPSVSLRLDVDLSHGLVRKLRARELDLALCLGPVSDTAVRDVSLGRVGIGWVASPQLGLPHSPVRPRDLAALPMILLSEDSGLHGIAMDWFRTGDAVSRRISFCNSMHTVSILVRSGQGYSVLPIDYCQPYLERAEMQRLESEPALSEVEYIACYVPARASPLVPLIASIAADMSHFDTGPKNRAAAAAPSA